MKRFSYHNEMMQLIVVALREIGNGNVSETQKNIIAGHLKKVNDEDFLHDMALAPIWVQKQLKELR